MLVNPEQLFAWAGALIAPCWLLLAASLWLPRMEGAAQWLAKLGLPIVFGTLYSAALLSHVPFDAGGFGSLSAVRALFQNDWLLLAGWFHYLLFDFFVGAWIVADSAPSRVPRLLVVPCLAGCFLAGPIGLLAYVLMRTGNRLISHPQLA